MWLISLKETSNVLITKDKHGWRKKLLKTIRNSESHAGSVSLSGNEKCSQSYVLSRQKGVMS